MSTYLEMREMYPDGPPMWMLPRFDEARVAHHWAVADAVDTLAETFTRAGTSADVAKTLSCGEAEALILLLRTAGHEKEADDWLRDHVESDTDMPADDIREIHGVDVGPCPECLDHPGWAHDDESRRRFADYCRACLGSGTNLRGE